MYHEGKLLTPSYYDTIDEMPNIVKVSFPNDKGYREMSPEDFKKLDDDGWYCPLSSSNYGCCDFIEYVKPSVWLERKFNKIIKYIDKNKNTIGYNRASWYIHLSERKKPTESFVWNS